MMIWIWDYDWKKWESFSFLNMITIIDASIMCEKTKTSDKPIVEISFTFEISV